MPRILVVDDEEMMRNLITEYLAFEGYEWDEAEDGTKALELFKSYTYDVIILDVMMPKVDGWSVCREVRRQSRVPIIMLTARGEEYDRLFGFELGVDDYMVKPFSPKELMARLKVILRRSSDNLKAGSDQERIIFEGLNIDLSSRNISVDGQTVKLTPKEYELLIYLVSNPNRAFSRQQILNGVWGYDYYGDDRTVDTHVKMLRESLKEYRKYIITVWGMGYKFETGAR